jgi:quercetin dioxygenase-like cupin family protein
MRFATIGAALAVSLFLAAAAQTQTPAPAITRTALAGATLPGLGDAPLYFRALGISLKPGEASGFTMASSILYGLGGTTDIALGGETRKLVAGDALYVPAGSHAALTATGSEPSNLLQFLLAAEPALNQAAAAAPAVVAEAYRTPAALPGLKPGSYELNLTRVTFPAGMPSNAPHHRSGAALYYILSGTGANTVAGTTADRGPRSWIYEPGGLVHQWGNPGAEPLSFLAFNINPQGVPAVVPETPPKP